jgi:ribonuclease HII
VAAVGKAKFAKTLPGTGISARAPKLTLGIDEAGRGPAIGPLVMGAVALDSKAAAALSRAGLRDSKSYGAGEDAHAIRCELAAKIRERATFAHTIVVEHHEVDARVARKELNVLERELASTLIEAAPEVQRIVADGKRMFAPLTARWSHFESHDHGEDEHAAVAAASVLAKVLRDQCFHRICARYHDEFGAIAGGGYANAGTRKFIRAFATRYGRLPDEARRSWPHPYVADLVPASELAAEAPQLAMF